MNVSFLRGFRESPNPELLILGQFSDLSIYSLVFSSAFKVGLLVTSRRGLRGKMSTPVVPKGVRRPEELASRRGFVLFM